MSINWLLSTAELDCGNRFFSRRVVGQWNDLPGDVAGATSLVSFKHKLDEYFTIKRFVYEYFWD